MNSDFEIFNQALACDEAKRETLLYRLCHDAMQRQRVTELLAAHFALERDFLEQPAALVYGNLARLASEHRDSSKRRWSS